MLLTRSLSDLRRALDHGELSAIELMEHAMDRIDEVNPKVNAIVSLRDRAEVMADVKAARPGPLSGIPVAIKDLTDTEGLRTTYGSPNFADHVPSKDARLAARLKAAGAILVGKTNTPEFGLGSQTFNPVFGQTLNPYDTSRTCGGSSGGASVAIATGMLPVADGSDMMGSLRNPAAWANIYGLRPTAGLIPRYGGTGPMAVPLSTDGAMARHPADLAIMLDVLGGDEVGWPHQVRDTGRGIPLDGLNVGWMAPGTGLAFEDGILATSEAALAQMADTGARVTSLQSAQFSREAAWQAWTGLRAAQVAMENAVDFEDADKRANMKATVVYEIENGLRLSTADLHRLNLLRAEVLLSLETALQVFDVLALPTTQTWPFPIEIEYPTEIAGETMSTYHQWMEVMIPASLPGLPSISIPAGFGPNGLPTGLQLIGRRGSDRDLIRIADDWDRVTGWPAKRPPSL